METWRKTCVEPRPRFTDTLMSTRPLSDHFDGKRFFNPTLPRNAAPSFFSVIKMLFTKRGPWPRFVKNVGIPSVDTKLRQDEVSVTFVNHATFLIQTKGVNILTDPVWSERASPFRWIGPKRVRKPGLELSALPRIDVILLSHNHYDHLDVDTLAPLAARFSPLTLVPIGNEPLVRSTGLTNVRELDWWDEAQIGAESEVIFTPSQHFAARNLFDRQKSLWGSFMIRSQGRLLYFGGDSGYSSHFREIRNRLGPPDIALLGIGAYEPRWFMKPMHMNPEEAVQAHMDLSAKQSIGMHFGTFRLTAEAFGSPKAGLRDALNKRGISDHAFTILNEGETRVF